MLFHSEAFTRRTFLQRADFRQMLLHTIVLTRKQAGFTHKCLCTIFCSTEKPVHKKILHREALTHRRKEAFAQRSFHTKHLLNTEAFTHRCVGTQRILYAVKFSPQRIAPGHTHSHFTTLLGSPPTISADGCPRTNRIRISEPHDLRRRLRHPHTDTDTHTHTNIHTCSECHYGLVK